MFNSAMYDVFHFQKSAKEYAPHVVLMPSLSDGYKHAARVFKEHGHIRDEPTAENNWFRQTINLGIPKASMWCSHSEREIKWFLMGIGSRSDCWDFRSVIACEFDLGELDKEFYKSMLAEINRSVSRRYWWKETFG
jgi:hypothetical protein